MASVSCTQKCQLCKKHVINRMRISQGATRLLASVVHPPPSFTSPRTGTRSAPGAEHAVPATFHPAERQVREAPAGPGEAGAGAAVPSASLTSVAFFSVEAGGAGRPKAAPWAQSLDHSGIGLGFGNLISNTCFLDLPLEHRFYRRRSCCLLF